MTLDDHRGAVGTFTVGTFRGLYQPTVRRLSRRYTDQQRADALLYLQHGLAARHPSGVPRGTLSSWTARAGVQTMQRLQRAARADRRACPLGRGDAGAARELAGRLLAEVHTRWTRNRRATGAWSRCPAAPA